MIISVHVASFTFFCGHNFVLKFMLSVLHVSIFSSSVYLYCSANLNFWNNFILHLTTQCVNKFIYMNSAFCQSIVFFSLYLILQLCVFVMFLCNCRIWIVLAIKKPLHRFQWYSLGINAYHCKHCIISLLVLWENMTWVKFQCISARLPLTEVNYRICCIPQCW